MMDSPKLPFRLRVGGWVVSLAGASMLLLSGGYSEETKFWFIAGAFSMVVGMILTSLSSLVKTLQYRKSLLKPSEPPQSSPPESRS